MGNVHASIDIDLTILPSALSELRHVKMGLMICVIWSKQICAVIMVMLQPQHSLGAVKASSLKSPGSNSP